MNRAAGYILAVLATAAICIFVGRRCEGIKEPPQERIVSRVDTLYVRDTLTVYKPSKVTRTVKDTVRVIVRETQIDTMHDTVFVYLPQESIVWRDGQMISYPTFVHFSHKRSGPQRGQILYSWRYKGEKVKE